MAQSIARKKKVTFFLSESTLEEMRNLVQAQEALSQNKLVEEALQEYIKKLRREAMSREFAEASRDPLFLSDVKEIGEDFKHADAESSGLIV